MTGRSFETTAAFHELLDMLRGADQNFLAGPRAVDDVSVVEGYRMLTEILHVAMDCYVWGDSARPTLVPIVGPTKKFGGDNADAFYHFAPVDPRRSYRIRGTRRDAVYLSLTIYGGPTDGRWSNRLVCTLNDRSMQIAADGSFEILVSAQEQVGDPTTNWMKLEGDAVALVTRDYLVDPVHQQQATFSIEALEPAPPPRLTDEDLAARFRNATNFLRDLLNITPLPWDPAKANTIDPPYPQPKVTYGWAAGDANYAMGAFELADDEVLIVEGTSPPCAFWNMVLWNPYLQTYDYRYERVTINGGQVVYEPDGSWRIAIAACDPGLPNWVCTAGHPRGRIWFRWFLAESLPERPAARVVKRDEER